MNQTKPQHIALPSIPGTLFKRLQGTFQRLRIKETTERDPVYLSRIRECPCLHCGLEPSGEAAHVRRQSGIHNKRGGMSKKPADRWALPLCHEHHMLQHRIGELRFWYDLRIDPLLVCEELYRQRDDPVAMRAVVLSAIAKRGWRDAVV